MQHLYHEKTLRKLELFSLEKSWLRGISSKMCAERMEAGSSPRCPVTRSKETSTN